MKIYTKDKKVIIKQGHFDIPYFLLFLIFIGVGLSFVYSSSAYISQYFTNQSFFFFQRHLIGIVCGFVLFYIFLNIRLEILFYYYKWIWVISLLLLIFPFIPGIGIKIHGANRWIDMGIRFQPSEIVKYGLIVYLSVTLYKYRELKYDFKRGFMYPFLQCFFLISLIIMEPDISTSISLFLVIFTLFYLWHTPISFLMSLMAMGLPLVLFLLSTKSYLLRRFSFFNPFDDPYGKGYHLIQSFIAFQNGGFTGRGPGNSIQKISSLPEAHNDFIYSIIIEEIGLLGGFFLLALFFVFLQRGFKIAKDQTDERKKMLVYGFSSLIAIEQIMHIFVVMGLFPTTGVPLPFISYGRTSLVMHMIMVGTILNVSREEKGERDYVF